MPLKQLFFRFNADNAATFFGSASLTPLIFRFNAVNDAIFPVQES